MVWASISKAGVSELYIQGNKGSAIKADIYIEKCLTKLKRFIAKYHKNDKILFWPDNASAHYAKRTVAWLNQNNIPLVPKRWILPNIPKARPIEDFWSLLCTKLYEKGWEVNNEDELIKRIRLCVRKIDFSVVQVMIGDVRKKIRKIEDHGPLSMYKSENK